MKFNLQNNKRHWYRSVVVKLMASLIAILLPLFVLFFMVFNISKDITTKEISKYTLAHISMYLDQLENEIGSIYKMQMNCSTNENLMAVSLITEMEDEYEKVKLINTIKDMINTMYHTNAYIKEVSVLLPSIDATISTKRLYDKLNFEEYSLFNTKYVLVLVIIAISIIVVTIVKKPLQKLSKGFKQVEMGNLDVTIEYKGEDEFSFIYQGFKSMLDTSKNLIDQVYKQKIFTQKAELKQLQSQINPHFLYNSFFMLSLMARNGGLCSKKVFCDIIY